MDLYQEDFSGKYMDFYIFTDDRADEAEFFRGIVNTPFMFAYSSMNGYHQVIPILDFTYDSWKECGMESYDYTKNKCIESGNNHYMDKRLFWIGNVKTNPIREKLLDLGNQHKDMMLIEAMGWTLNNKGENIPTKFISLYDHAKHKYLIDVEGRGWSARLKFLFFLKRPIFIQERDHKEFWFSHLCDMKNCVMIKHDLSDLMDKLKLLEEDDELYQHIVYNGEKFAQKYLSKEYALECFKDAVLKYGIRKE